MKPATLFVIPLLFFGYALHAQSGQDSMMKAWTAYMTPSDVHKMIAKADGDWNTEVTLWMDPKSPPTKSTGTCTNKMVLGGRYQESVYKGNFMNMPMEGKGTLAYDNAKKVFQSTWIDNMGTGIMVLDGTWDEAAKAINFTGSMVDPISGKNMKIREVYKMIDDNNHLMEMYVDDGSQEFKSMEIKFAKK